MVEELPQRIVVAVDGSETSMKAAAYAIELAGLMNADLVGVTVILLPPHAAEETLEKLRKELSVKAVETLEKVALRGKEEGVKVKYKVVETDQSVVKAIVDTAAQLRANLIVVGTRGTSGISKMMLGSVAAGVVSFANTPVLAVR